ncbi:MAG: cytochrome c biogenesis protein [Clostridia bacterium]
MADVGWIYDVTIFLYAASVLFYFHDFLQSNREVNRMAFGLLAIVWCLQTIFFVSQMTAKLYFPVLTLFETLFFYSWVLVTLSMILNYFFRIDLIVFFTNVIGFIALSFSMFAQDTGQLEQTRALTSELLFVHITLSIISYGAFSLSMIFSVMYLVQHHMLKRKRWTTVFRRLPSLDRLELFSDRMNMIGMPLLLLGVILGSIWAHLVLAAPFWMDTKVGTSVIMLIAYSIIMYQRYTEKWQGSKLATANLVAFSLLLINFLSSDVSSFHRWM